MKLRIASSLSSVAPTPSQILIENSLASIPTEQQQNNRFSGLSKLKSDYSFGNIAMHPVGSAGNTANSVRPRKEKRLTYVLNDADDTKHCAGINCLSILKSPSPDKPNYLFSGSRDGTLRRWEVSDDVATCSATFESHVDWVNDAVIVGGDTLVSCSSDTTVKTWNCFGDGTCSKTLRQHSDYVTCLAAAESNRNIFASGGLGGEVFIWDLEAALTPAMKQNDAAESECSNGVNCSVNTSLIKGMRTVSSSNNICLHPPQAQGYVPVAAKGHKQSVYAMALNDTGTVLVSGGTEKVVRVWDTRSGAKTIKLRGHHNNIRALLLDSSGRFCLSGSSDNMIRLWDLGQQRCIHSYAVHTDSVWALASTPSFSHVYSGGRDNSLYLTDLSTRDSLLLCTRENPILQLALQDDSIWVASTDSSIERWPAEGRSPEKAFEKGESFFAGNLSFPRGRVSLEGSTPAPVYKEPSFVIHGIPGIMKYEILNNRRHILTKDTSDSVKLWDITQGVVIEDYGKVSFDDKKEKLFEMVSIPAWFTVDAKLGGLSIHLDTPQCFSAEMYSVDLHISGKSEEDKVNLARETLKGLLSHWFTKRKQKFGSKAKHSGDTAPGKELLTKSSAHSKSDVDGNVENDFVVHPPFEFSGVSPPSIITEGSSGGPWRKKITLFDGTEDEKDFPTWCLDAVLNNPLPPNETTKLSFYLQPCEGSPVKILTQGKLSAPRILKIHKVVHYVLEKMVLNRPLDILDNDIAPFTGGSLIGDGPLRGGSKLWPKLKPTVEILCNNQVLPPEMSLATVRAFIWKKPEDLILNYR